MHNISKICYLLFAIIIIYIQVQVTSITIRVQLSNGLIHRLDIDEDTSTKEIGRILLDKGYLTEKATYSIKEKKFNISDSNASSIVHHTLKDLGIVRGEMIRIESNENIISMQKNQTLRKEEVNMNSSAKRYRERKTIKSQTASINELSKARQQLTKIKKEKTNKHLRILLSTTTGRILKRLSNGGTALAIGRIIENKPAIVSARQRKGIIHTIDDSSVEKDKPLISVEVHSLLELESCNEVDSSGLSWNLEISAKEKILKAKELARRLKMDIVGCCIGLPIKSKLMTWSSYHTHTVLQLKSLLNQEINSNFICIGCSNAARETTESIPLAAAHKKTIKRTSFQSLQNKDFGLTLEGYILSNQSVNLHVNNILPKVPIFKNISDFNILPTNDKENFEKLLIEKISKVHLSGSVLIQSQESQELDSVITAIPIAISTLQANDTPKFEHSFPTINELSNIETARQAKKHILKILGSSSSEETRNRLRDPHLLVYLENLMDDKTLEVLAHLLMDSDNKKLPGYIVASLDILKMALT